MISLRELMKLFSMVKRSIVKETFIFKTNLISLVTLLLHQSIIMIKNQLWFLFKIMNMDFDGPDGYDPDKMVDQDAEQEMMEKMAKFQHEKAGQNKPYLDKVFSLIQEAADKNII